MIVAHRGFAHEYPENTLYAFTKAENEADYIEMDIRTSKNGIPVIAHDPSIEIGDDEYNICDVEAENFLTRFEFVSEVIETPLVVELKDENSIKTVVDILSNRNQCDIIQSFNPAIPAMIDEYIDNGESIKSALLCASPFQTSIDGVPDSAFTDIGYALSFIQENNIPILNAHHKLLSSSIVKRIPDEIEIGAWTIRNKDIAQTLSTYEIDYYITDSPKYTQDIVQNVPLKV